MPDRVTTWAKSFSSEKLKDDPVDPKNGEGSVTCVYQSHIGGYWRNVTVIWRKNLMNYCLTISVDSVEKDDHKTCKIDLKPWHFWAKKGYKTFEVDGNQLEAYWDLKSAKFSGSPEPFKDFYVALIAEEEVVLLLGDYQKKAYKRTKSKPALVDALLFYKKEHVFGKKSFSTRATFENNKKESDIVVESSTSGPREPEMWISIDGIVLIHIKNLQWKFRGNQTVLMNEQQVQVFWDVHSWLFSEPAGSSHGLFIFKPGVSELESDRDGSSVGVCISLFGLEANTQVDQSGVYIDCGIRQDFNYTNAATGLHYVSDSGFIDTHTGSTNATISIEFQTPDLEQQLFTLTSFPQGTRNCYTIRVSQGKGNKYLIRARFLYGNYDGKSQQPDFDLHLGVDFWDTIKIVNASTPLIRETIHVLSSDFVHVCLVNTGRGTPFISALELRLFNDTRMYTNVSGSLQTVMRLDLGSTSTQFVRYQDDIYDRLWLPYNDVENTISLNTSSTIDSLEYDNYFQPPSKVMSTAITSDKGNNGITFSWEPANSTEEQYIYLHFAELIEPNQGQGNRQFNIYVNGILFYYEPVVPNYLHANTVYSKSALSPRSAKYQITLNRTGNSVRPPIINAIEIYKVVKQITTSQTYDLDVEVIRNLKSTYGIKMNWQGDPCRPEADKWIGLRCNSDVDSPRIISLNLSSSELHGTISPHIANLSKLESLDLSNNKLTGEVPAILSQLAFLRVLYLKGNSFSGQMPEDLLAKSRNGSLLLSYDGETNGGSNSHSDEKKNKKLTAAALASIVLSVVVLGLLALLLIFWMIRKKNQQERKQSQNIAFELKNRQFTYSEVLHLTNNFQKILGKGGFGTVYLGYTDDRDVAVKILSPSSAQGFKEFHAEANLLMSIHHKNLISVVGYCVEGTNICIIYEYMPNRSLDIHLSDRNPNPLTWEERLQIGLDAAQGLEYLHHGCQPPIIHRDIKSTNILLDDKFRAKLADFGLSRILPTGEGSHVTTTIAGTPGYLDPEHYRSNKLTEKSDVYSFGVVLLEMITGRNSIGKHDKIYVITWVKVMLEKRDVSKVIDPRLLGEVDVNSARKVVELAMACVSLDPTSRPAMSLVVLILKQCLREVIGYDSN
ncbi:hypothetical protein HAX54_016873 [Datura stramonium]|uniref:non-specific serine/threonine protein kinase n=1 Tax=Datura stramonium TaxID=4076 RepID=A0ABS8RLA0_DATST|nr:hypothetical protein [Datura stramonium]